MSQSTADGLTPRAKRGHKHHYFPPKLLIRYSFTLHFKIQSPNINYKLFL